MKKIQRLILAGCMTLAGLCYAQMSEFDYVVIDLSGSPGDMRSVSYTNDTPYAEGWTNGTDTSYFTDKLVLQKFEVTPTDYYFVSVSKVTRGQYAQIVGPGDPGEAGSAAPLDSSDSTSGNVGTFFTNLKVKEIPNIFQASTLDNALQEPTFSPDPDGFYVYLRPAMPQPYYAMIDLSGGLPYPIVYTNDTPYPEGWTDGTDTSYLTDWLVLQKLELSPTDHYYISVSKVTRGQYARIVGGGDPDDPTPTSESESNDAFVTLFFSALGVTGIPTAQFIVSENGNMLVAPDFPTNPNGFYVYLKTDYLLTVNGGTGSVYTNGGATVFIDATVIPGVDFEQWVVESGVVGSDFISTNANTELVMPFNDVTLTASNSVSIFKLTVNGGTGSGNFTNGHEIAILATNASPATLEFDQWTGDTNTVADIFAADTTVTIDAADITLTAVFKARAYELVLNTYDGGSVTSDYPCGDTISLDAGTPPPNQMFNGWEVVPGLSDLSGFDASEPVTSLVMPANNVTVTAKYTPILYTLTVVNGSWDGSHTNGAVVSISGNKAPSTEHVFDRWENPVNVTVADSSVSSTTVTMLGGAASITAVYKPKAKAQNTYMVVDMAGGTTYQDEPPAGGWTDPSYQGSKMVFRKVPAGSFIMGSPAGEAGRHANETQHPVKLTKDFYLGIFEVTQAQWQQIDGSTPGHFSGSTLPVEMISYEDIRGPYADANWPSQKNPTASSFMGKLRAKPGLAAADLPTEAQWEYACRAGTTGAYAGVPSEMAWYGEDSSSGATHDVGTKSPNAWGLYDMHGNVAEICLDWFNGGLGTAEQTDPPGVPTQGGVPLRVLRGGAYDAALVGDPNSGGDSSIRSAFRGSTYVTNYVAGDGRAFTNRLKNAGFRVAVPQTTASYTLTVVNGDVNTGGVFQAGTKIGLTSKPALDDEKFGAWQVEPMGANLGAEFNYEIEQTLLTMPSNDVKITAIYIPTNAIGIFRFVINNPGAPVQLLMANGKSFTLTAPDAAPGYRFSGWTVLPAGALSGFDATLASTTVVMPAMDVTVTPNYTQDVLAPTVGVTFSHDASEGLRPATFSAKGLPSGLKIDRTTGVISGTPSKTGTFNVQVTAKRSDGSTDTYTIPVTVKALPANAQGTFTGYLYADGGAGQDQVKGLVSFKVSAKGALSAKLTTQTTTYSFSTKAWSSVSGNIFRATMVRRQGETLMLELDAATGTLTSASTFGGGALGSANAFYVYAQRNALMDKGNPMNQTYKGNYTVALPVTNIVTDTAGVDNTQSGSGYLTVTIRDRGAVKVAGKLADGTRVSLSTTLIVDGSDAYIPLFTKLYSRRGVFAGLLQISGSAAPALQVIDVSNTRLEWIYPGRNASMTGDRFSAQLGAYGAFYNTLADIQTAYTGAAFQTEENFGWPTLLVIPGTSGSLALPKKGTPENPAGVVLKAVKKTGIFSGSFKTTDPVTSKNVTLKHAGILTRNGSEYIGEGAYIRTRKVGGYTLKSSYWVEID